MTNLCAKVIACKSIGISAIALVHFINGRSRVVKVPDFFPGFYWCKPYRKFFCSFVPVEDALGTTLKCSIVMETM